MLRLYYKLPVEMIGSDVVNKDSCFVVPIHLNFEYQHGYRKVPAPADLIQIHTCDQSCHSVCTLGALAK